MSTETIAANPAARTAAAPRSLQSNLIRDVFSAIDDRQFDRLDEFFTPDTVYERPGYEPICGLPALQHFYREVRVITQGQHQLTHVLQDAGAAAAWGRFVGQAQNGNTLDERFADVYVIRAGKVAHRITNFFRPAL